MSEKSIIEQMDELTLIARERMSKACPDILGLLPTECDWYTSEEMAKLHSLKMQLPSYGQMKQEAIERIKIKRQERLAKRLKPHAQLE